MYWVFEVLLSSYALHFWASYGMVVLSCVTFVACVFITAPYGRHSEGSSDQWGPKIPARLAWILMESPSPILVGLFFWCTPHEKTITHYILLCLFELHYINRTFIFPLRMNTPTPMYFSIALQAFVFNLFNGYLQGFQTGMGSYSGDEIYNWRFLAGVVIFLSGWYINYDADNILRNLRKPGEKREYKIPFGGAFRWVTAANYFGEIVEWFGWALATYSVAGLGFALFTASNIGPRGYSHHKWYLEKFGDKYPRNRKAIIPYIL